MITGAYIYIDGHCEQHPEAPVAVPGGCTSCWEAAMPEAAPKRSRDEYEIILRPAQATKGWFVVSLVWMDDTVDYDLAETAEQAELLGERMIVHHMSSTLRKG